MKKSLIALAVAATAATPMAASAAALQAAGDQEGFSFLNTTFSGGIELYGSFRPHFRSYSIERRVPRNGKNRTTSESNSDILDGGSRWGLRGTHDLGNGLSAFYHLERPFSTADAIFKEQGRLAYAGLKGSFGGVAIGQQWTPYYISVASPSDIFAGNGSLPQYYDLRSDEEEEAIESGERSGPGRMGENLTYALPDGLPVRGAIAIRVGETAAKEAAEENGNKEDDALRALSIGLGFDAGPITIGLGYHNIEGDEDNTRLGLSLGADIGPVQATFMIEDVDQGDDDEDDTNPWAITASMRGFAIQYSDYEVGNVDVTGITLGYTYKLSGNTRIQLEWATLDADRPSGELGIHGADEFLVRYRVDF